MHPFLSAANAINLKIAGKSGKESLAQGAVAVEGGGWADGAFPRSKGPACPCLQTAGRCSEAGRRAFAGLRLFAGESRSVWPWRAVRCSVGLPVVGAAAAGNGIQKRLRCSPEGLQFCQKGFQFSLGGLQMLLEGNGLCLSGVGSFGKEACPSPTLHCCLLSFSTFNPCNAQVQKGLR